MKNDHKQLLHLEPQSGWLNDPNGLSCFGGKYHIYFQYSPDSPDGSGRKCWGHFESPDLLNYRFTGTVLYPDTPDDRSGVYSGCGLVKDDLLYLFYTGNVKEEGEHDYITSGRGANVILVTTGNGHDMSEKRTLLRNADYPEYCSCHVRDPKVWEEDGRYRMVLGARTLDDRGCVLYYTSDDLLNWTYDSTLFGGDGSYMWECPDEFVLSERRFLSVSPQGVPHGEFMYQNVYSSGYFELRDGEPRDYREWDCGFDFYAPQSFEAPDGRRLLIGWMGIGDIPYTNPTVSQGRQHCLTLPRELTVGREGGIYQRPMRELNALKGRPVNLADGETLEAGLPFYFASLAERERFTLTFEDMLEMSCADGVFTLRFTNDKVGCGRDIRRAKIGRFTGIEIVADTSSLEIFLNGGEAVMSTRFYPGEMTVRLHSDGIEGSVYPLRAMEVIRDE